MVEYIKEKRFVSIDELVHVMKVSKATIHRDLTVLNNSRGVILTRGGAAWDEPDITEEMLYNAKKVSNAEEKELIGKKAASLIKNNSSVLLAAGTSTRAIIPHIDKAFSLNVVTNDIAIAGDLSARDSIEVAVTGGQLRKNHYTLRGFAAENFISNMHLDLAFVGFDAIDSVTGCYIANFDEVPITRMMVQIAKKTIAVCDSSKFKRTAFVQVCTLADIDMLITDSNISDKMVANMQASGVEVIVV